MAGDTKKVKKQKHYNQMTQLSNLTNIECLVIDLLHNHVLWLQNKGECTEQSIHMEPRSLEGLKEISAAVFPNELPKLNEDEPNFDILGFNFKVKL